MERIGIFAFFDNNGIVQKYVSYLLDDLKKNLSKLVIVCNGLLAEEGRHIFTQYTDDIFIRENKGYDIGAFKESIISLLGWDEIAKYDELILCNDTFFGPFIPFENIFTKMEGRKVDFWGLSAQPDSIDFWEGTERIVPAFIQSFFIAVGSRMLHSQEFKKYWDNLNVSDLNITQIVVRHEQYFTHYFETIGFSWDVFTSMDLYSSNPVDNNYTAYLRYPYELIKYGNCPFLKKKCLVGNDISKSKMPDNGSLRKALEYIDRETGYNVDCILDYLAAKCSRDIVERKTKSFHIVYTDKAEKEQYSSHSILDDQQTKTQDKMIVLFVRISNPITAKLIYSYLLKICDMVFCYIFCKEEIRNLFMSKEKPERIYFLSDYLFEEYVNDTKRYIKQRIDYVGVIRDRKEESIPEPICTWISYHRMLCENMIAGKEYIKEIIKCFEHNVKLGMLEAPQERFASFLGNDYEDNMHKSYWCRYQILNTNKNYVSGKIFGRNYAGLVLLNEIKILSDIFKDNMSGEEITNYASYLEHNLMAFCNRHTRLFIYGAGGVGIRTAHAFLKKGIHFEGFIVSDGQFKDQEVLGHKVYWLSELTQEMGNIGVIIAVEKNLYDVIEKNLCKYQIGHYEYSCY